MTEWRNYGEGEPLRQRSHVTRLALLFTGVGSIFAALATVALIQIISGNGGFIVMLGIFGGMGGLILFQARQYLRDLKADVVTREGEVVRKWHKGNVLFFFMPSFYIFVEYAEEPGKLQGDGKRRPGHVYSITRQEYGGLLEEDRVRILCFPASLTVERLERYDTNTREFVPAASGTLP